RRVLFRSPILSNLVTDPMGKQTLYRFTPDGLLTDVTDDLAVIRIFLRDAQKSNQIFLTGSAAGVSATPVVGRLLGSPESASAKRLVEYIVAAASVLDGTSVSPG